MAVMETAAADPVGFFINYGVAGMVVVLLVTGQIRTKAEVTGLIKALDAAAEREREKDQAVAALVAQITQHTLPQITALSDVLERLPQSSEKQMQAQLDALSATLARLDKRAGGTPDG